MILTCARCFSGSQTFSASCRWVRTDPSARFCRDSRRYMYPRIFFDAGFCKPYPDIHVSRRFRSERPSRTRKRLFYLTLDTVAAVQCASQLSNSGETLGRGTHPRVVGSLPPTGKGLREPRTQCGRVYPPRLDPTHVAKAMQSKLNFPDRLL